MLGPDLFDPVTIYVWEELIGNWFFVASMAFLGVEIIRYGVQRRLTWNLTGDTVTNFITLIMFLAIVYVAAAAYVGAFFYVYENYALAYIPINGWTIAACIVAADFAYYWEHRFMHRVGFAWATHTVHHSSPNFNISVAYRFGPLDGLLPIFFHMPLTVFGFHPFLIFFSEAMVQFYQTALHTEFFGKLWRPIELIMNTPSHHRVHHGSNPQYLDKNYAGIFIIWDRMFGTFEEEDEKVVYGLVKPIESNNPFVAFFHGFSRLASDMANAGSFKGALACLIMAPGENPAAQRRAAEAGELEPART